MAEGSPVQVGASATVAHHVTHTDTAAALGSGDLPVLATPRVLAWLEHATCEALGPALSDGRTSVGSRVRLEHLRPSAVGTAVQASAEVVAVDGRLVRFEVSLTHTEDGQVAAHGEVTRIVVDAERFMARL